MELPISPSCERNKEPISLVLKEYLEGQNKALLEIGSGTGQHATYFGQMFPKIKWQTSDLESNHKGINLYIDNYSETNVLRPISFEIGKDSFPSKRYDFIFTANTFHIMGWKQVKTLIKMLGKRLPKGALVMIYGPFNYGGKYSSQSNREFDQWLKERNPLSAIRNFEDVVNVMAKNDLELLKDHEMPANNRLLVFKR